MGLTTVQRDCAACDLILLSEVTTCQFGWTENAGLQNARPKCRGGNAEPEYAGLNGNNAKMCCASLY